MLDLTTFPDPIFEEALAVATARQNARRLATTDLPIIVEGEPGTGRRTLATDLSLLRREQSGNAIVQLDAVGDIDIKTRSQLNDNAGRRFEVLVDNLESLSKQSQVELSDLARRHKIRIVAVARWYDKSDDDPDDARQRATSLDSDGGAARVLLPPLRDRGDDVLRWAQFLLERAAIRFARPAPRLSPGAQRAIRRGRWPGNLIELDATLNRSLCLSISDKLDASDLGLADGDAATPEFEPLADALENFRRSYVARALAYYSGNRTQTARALKVDPRTIFRYLEKK